MPDVKKALELLRKTQRSTTRIHEYERSVREAIDALQAPVAQAAPKSRDLFDTAKRPSMDAGQGAPPKPCSDCGEPGGEHGGGCSPPSEKAAPREEPPRKSETFARCVELLNSLGDDTVAENIAARLLGCYRDETPTPSLATGGEQ
jgi:hypothetical protein